MEDALSVRRMATTTNRRNRVMSLFVFILVILLSNFVREADGTASGDAASFVCNHRRRRTGWQCNHHHHGCKKSFHLLPQIHSRMKFHELHVISTNENDTTTPSSKDGDDDDNTNSNVIDNKKIPDDIIYSLDLKPLLYEVARHAGTKRGRNALLLLANIDEETSKRSTSLGQSSMTSSSSKRRRAIMTTTAIATAKSTLYQERVPTTSDSRSSSSSSKVKNNKSSYAHRIAPIATSQFDARKEYEYVEQAMLCLSNENDSDDDDGNSNTNKKNSKNKDSDYIPNLTYPPLYSIGSSPEDYTTIINDTDDDEWISIRSFDGWTLEHILQAEKVIEKLLNVRKWAKQDVTQTWVPLLSQIGCSIDSDGDVKNDDDNDDGDDNSSVLPAVYKEISNKVEIVRARSLMDPSGSSTFAFRFNYDKFPVLKLLREKEENLYAKGIKEFDRELLELQTEIEQVEEQIRIGLVSQIQAVSGVVNHGLDLVARLDVIFAKAAYSKRVDGMIPHVGNEGRIDVPNFIHPLLLHRGIDSNADSESSDDVKSSVKVSSKAGARAAVPINLHLSSDAGDRALIISGPNGGGKTISMKSFGLVCMLCRLGIPIPISNDPLKLPHDKLPKQARVDFFDNILVEAGDRQSVVEGESTWTAKINVCAAIIDRVHSTDLSQTSIVLLDELGGGTDPEAGGAIAQAILEHLLKVDQCRIVATTHSPRLKALSYENPDFGCATMLLERQGNGKPYQVPTFCLEYGLIGESHALGAASRSKPALPAGVLSRATELMSNNPENSDGNYMSALTSSLENQLDMANQAKEKSEEYEMDSARCRSAMIGLAAAYDNQLAQLEKRIDNCYQRLTSAAAQDKLSDLEIVGETLSELRVVQKEIKSHQELLTDRGLKVLPLSYDLEIGESVVIIAPGEWDGMTAQVVATSVEDDRLAPTQVRVNPSSFFDVFDKSSSEGDPTGSPSLILQRHEVAIWDYDSIWDYDALDAPASVASATNSKRRLTSLLSTLKTKDSASPNVWDAEKKKSTSLEPKTTYNSSRERKAATKKNKKRGK